MGQIGGFGMQITTHSADETQALGQRLAKRLLPGDVIAYFGDLGAGKTALTRGACGLLPQYLADGDVWHHQHGPVQSVYVC